MMKNVVILLLLCLWPLDIRYAHCTELTIAAAANTQPVLVKLIAVFNKLSTVTITTVFGSSGKLTAQIQNGAPFDIFLSADMRYPETLYRQGYALAAPKTYAYGTLVVFSMKQLDVARGMDVFDHPRIKSIALANPQIAPYGAAAVDVLKYYGVYENTREKLVYGQSVAQVNDFIISEAVDIGLTAKSTVLSLPQNRQGVWWDVPKQSYARIAQGVVMLINARGSREPQAWLFYDFLWSAEARTVLHEFGYLTDE